MKNEKVDSSYCGNGNSCKRLGNVILENNMTKTFVFIYFMKNEPDSIRAIVPLHIAYWKKNKLMKYSGGPFADKSGGLITFEAADLEQAKDVIEKDPFITQEVIEKQWIKEWLPE